MKDISFLERERQISFDWHITQVIKWLKFDNGRKLDSVLVYASLELRCAIERYLFELLLLLKKDKLTTEEQRRCQSKEGILDLIKETEPYYIKRAKFTNLIASVTNYHPKVILIDIKYLIRMWHTLSDYCHKQLNVMDSFGSSNREFQKNGFRILNDVVNRFVEWERKGAFGIIDIQSMPPEVRDVYDKYVNDEIGKEKAKGMLRLMEPVLRARFR